MNNTGVPESLRVFLDAYDTYYLIGHIDPDGDCICSALATAAFLERRGKAVKLFNEGPFDRPEIREYAHHFRDELPRRERELDDRPAVVVLDCSTQERIGTMASDVEGLPTAVIDHHASGQPFGNPRFLQKTAPSTSYLIQLVIESFGMRPTAYEAELILLAIGTDTGFFRHLDRDTGDTFRAVARLVDAGASPKSTYEKMYGGKSLAARKLLARQLERTEEVADGQFIITYERADDTEEFGKENRESDTLYRLLTTVDGCRALALVREVDQGSCTGSLRSTDDTDVGEIAAQFGGGGHPRAAGFLAQRPWNEVVHELKAIFATKFR
jgi:phosphoesterase RecJ-like protein